MNVIYQKSVRRRNMVHPRMLWSYSGYPCLVGRAGALSPGNGRLPLSWAYSRVSCSREASVGALSE